MSKLKIKAEYEDRIRERVLAKLQASDKAGGSPFDPSQCDQVMEVLQLIARENDLDRAATRLFEQNQGRPGTAMTAGEAAALVSEVFARFGREAVLCFELHQLCEVERPDPIRITGHMEFRWLDDDSTPTQMPLELSAITWTIFK